MPLISGRIVLVLGLILLIGGGVYVATSGDGDDGDGPAATTAPDFGGAIETAPTPEEPPSAPVQPDPESPAQPEPTPAPRPRPAVAGPPVTELRPLVRELKRRFGAKARLRTLVINEILIVADVARGPDDTRAFLWRPETQTLEERDPSPITSDRTIPLSRVRAGVPLRLRTKIRRRDRRFVASTYNLFFVPVADELIWQISGKRGERQLTYRAKPDGSQLTLLG